jgi:Cytochrome C oxidase, cbb3-type, subunit III
MNYLLGIAILSCTAFSLAQQPAAPSYSVPQASATTAARGDTEGAGSTIFGNCCESCHGKVEAAPAPAILKKMTSEHIYNVLSQGDMAPMAKDLTDKQKRDIAEWVGDRKLGGTDLGDASKMSNVCSTNPSIDDVDSAPAWNGWSPGLVKTRYQPGKAADLSAAKVERLKLKWAFGSPAADSVYGQRTIFAGRMFVTSDAGRVYSIGAKSGCVYWSFQAGTGIRRAITVRPVKPGSSSGAMLGILPNRHDFLVAGQKSGMVWAHDPDAKGAFTKINGVKAHGGSIGSAGPTVADGMLYVTSGYTGFQNGGPGNVLLAFGQ